MLAIPVCLKGDFVAFAGTSSVPLQRKKHGDMEVSATTQNTWRMQDSPLQHKNTSTPTDTKCILYS
jgi:hypothetical protein